MNDSSPDPQQPDADPQPDDTGAAGREAGRYRRQLRETEQQRDGLTARLSAIETRHVERLASTHLAQAGDLLTIGGVTLDELRDPESGEVDDQLVTAAIAALLAARPGLAKPPRPPDFDGGQRAGVITPPGDWQRVIRGH